MTKLYSRQKALINYLETQQHKHLWIKYSIWYDYNNQSSDRYLDSITELKALYEYCNKKGFNTSIKWITLDNKTISIDFSELSDLLSRFKLRIENLRLSSRSKAISKLRLLNSELPNSGKCLHLAHNWLVCGKDAKKSRSAKHILDSYYHYCTSLNDLSNSYYNSLYCRTL